MNDMNGYAQTCGVEIKVTSHFRRSPVTGNQWNAKRSCHMIGHAIDMNLLGKNGFCDGSCLSKYSSYNGPDSSINCFLKKIRYVHPLLHWGIDFNDPVHIDDRLCTDAAEYDKVHATLSGC
ncbi:uncharacterized protein [Watersipora subatra]|uniref:uncharacterized protein n=1 Tax=Watersipora subatra TaxID=2589382 RepID=UPI00355C1F04